MIDIDVNILKEYVTPHGFVKTHKDDNGNNGILFRAYLDYLGFKNPMLHPRYIDYVRSPDGVKYPNYFYGNYPEHTTHFSVDNMTGLYAAYIFQGKKVDDLPVFRWNDRIWWHPNGWAVFLSARYPILKPVFFPLLYVMARISFNREMTDTTGRLLWWLRFRMLGYDKILRHLNKKGGLFPWSFEYYFVGNPNLPPSNNNHPIPLTSKEYFKQLGY